MISPPRSTATNRLTRVTLVGPRRRADLVLPSDEPVGILLPEIVALVGLGPAADPRGYQVSRLDGGLIDPAASLRGAGVTDGALLRVDPLVDAPPPAVLHDVSGEIADDLGRRPGRWDDTARRRTATATVVAGALLAGVLAVPHVPAVVLTVCGLLVLLLGSAVAVFGERALGVATLLAGAAVAMAAVPGWTAQWPHRWALWALGAAVTVLVLGIATGHQRAGGLGAGTLLGLLGLWVGMPAAGLPVVDTAAVLAVASVAGLGLVPRLALVASGLTRLDDRLVAEEPVPRASAEAAMEAAHRGLAIASVVTAASAALAGWLLAQAGGGWASTLSVLVGVAVLLRLRAYPLTVEVAGLTAAALVVAFGLLCRWMQVDPARWWAAALVGLLVAGTGLVVLGYRPPPHVRARARQLADRVEAIAVIALVPGAVGELGGYTRLLDTF